MEFKSFALCILLSVYVVTTIETQDIFFTDLHAELTKLNPNQSIGDLSCGYFHKSLVLRCSPSNLLTNLWIIDLSLTSIPSSISFLSQSLATISIVNSELSSLDNSFSLLTNLRDLNLKANKFSLIPETISPLSQLTELIFSKNTIASIPDCFSTLSNLSYLEFESNSLSSIPLFLFTFSKLTDLVISSNCLTTLPKEISDLSLHWLWLNDNPSLQANTDLFKGMQKLEFLTLDNTLVSGLKLESVMEFTCDSSCVSSTECTKNKSCSCDVYSPQECPFDRCGMNSQQLCIDCSSFVSLNQCTGDCEWCSGKKENANCYWCDLIKRKCSDSSRCNVCAGYLAKDQCIKDSDCQWCGYEYCTSIARKCELNCSILLKEKCESKRDCAWCSSYESCLDSSTQCLACDRFSSTFCPPGCDCSTQSKTNPTVIIIVCVVIGFVFLLLCVCLFVFLKIRKRRLFQYSQLPQVSLRFDDTELNETPDHTILSQYTESYTEVLFRVSQEVLSFSSSGSPLKLDTSVTVSFELTNICGMALVVDRLFVKGFKEKHEFAFSPSSFTIGKNEKQKVSVELKMKCSASLSPSQSFICCGISNKRQWCSLCGIQAQSELSTLLSCDDIELKRELGRGTFGKVFLGSFRGTEVAIKVSNGMSIDDFNIEANTLSKLHSPHIVTFYGISQTLNAMIIEYCKYGSIEEYYSHNTLSEKMKRLICFDISRGMKYLHLNGIIHRDLKPANILLSSLSTDLNVSRSKISDFGTSRASKLTMKMTKGVGTPSFMAPEIFDESEYGRSSDVYAFGMTIWSIFTQKPPFEGESMNSIITLVSDGKRPDLPNCDCKVLIERCWAQKPDQRPSFEEITEQLRKQIETH